MPQPSIQSRNLQRMTLAILGAAVLSWLAWQSRVDLQRVLVGADRAWMLLAVLLGVILTVTQALLFSSLMAKHSTAGKNSRVIAAFLLSQPGKYIPGKVWSALMQSFALRQGTGLGRITIANIEMALIAALQMAALGLTCLRPNSFGVVTGALLGGLALTTAVMRMPTTALLTRALPWLARHLRLQPETGQGRRDGIGYLTLVAGASMAVNFAASWSVLRAAGPAIPDVALMPILASLYLGFAASMLVFPVPAGIGIREATVAGLASLLAPSVTPALIISIALFTRGWQLLVDIACLCIGWLLLRSPQTVNH